MSQLQLIATLTVHEGKLDDFRATADTLIGKVREKDTGTLQYDWYFSADQTVCTVIETYRDSDALLEHIANGGETLGTLFSLCDVDIQVYGEPSQELRDRTADMSVGLHTPFQSL